MRKTKIIAVFITFYLTSLMMSFLGFQSAYANAMETPSNYTNVEVKFIVYPDGTVGLAGKYNYTSEYPFYLFGPYTPADADIELDAQITKNGGMHDVSIVTTLTVPSEEASEFPFNATTATMTGEYSSGTYTTDISVSVTFPDSFYTDSTLVDFSIFPFNSTDVTIAGEYSEQSFNGTITVHMLPGFTLGDINVNFEGNLTNLTIDDELTVFYNYTLPIPGFPSLNETSLNELLLMLNRTIPGVGLGSLYDMIGGMLTCTTFNTTLTPIDANSATVSFLVIIQGDFIELLTKLFTGSLMGVPSPYPEGAIYSLINATLHSLENADFTLSYSKAAKQLDLQAAVRRDVEYDIATSQMLPEMYPPEMRPYIESMLNTTYCSLYSSTETLSFQSGQMSYEVNYTIEDDLNAEVNYLQNLYFDMMNATYPVPPQMNILKDIYPDISNLHLNFKMENISMLSNFDGAKVTPPIDSINTTCFRLERLFNMASSEYEPPRENEKMKLIVQGGSNGTHTVTLFIDPTDPERVPNPDEFAEGNTMIWNNQSISKLKRLIFKVSEGYAETIHNPASVTQDNPFMIDAEETASCVLTLTNVSKSATLYIKNITAPTDISPPPGTYNILGNYIQITADPKDVTTNGTIRIYYTPEQLSELGLDENSLKIFYWNEAANDWEAIDTQINTAEHYVWATVSHLSIWVLMGQPLTTLWEQPWFQTLIVVIIAIVIIAVLLGLRRKKP